MCLFHYSQWMWSSISLWFWFASPWWQIMSRISCVYRPLLYLICRHVYPDPLSIFKLCQFSFYLVVRVLHIFWIPGLIRYMICKKFFHSVGYLVTFLIVSLKHKFLKFWWNLIFPVFHVTHILMLHYSWQTQSHEDLPLFFFPKSFILQCLHLDLCSILTWFSIYGMARVQFLSFFFSFLHVAFLGAICCTGHPFSHGMILALLLNVSWP